MMDELVEWLREQIARDERIARAAHERLFVGFIGHGDRAYFEDKGFGFAVSEHIARQRPLDVLALCEAHLRIIGRWEQARDNASVPTKSQGVWEHIARTIAEDVVVVALAYRRRPGFRPEWQL